MALRRKGPDAGLCGPLTALHHHGPTRTAQWHKGSTSAGRDHFQDLEINFASGYHVRTAPGDSLSAGVTAHKEMKRSLCAARGSGPAAGPKWEIVGCPAV
ncbi:hypothetical protein E2C01_011190 [Portunus trituberculatus]|uniref:Uncharacterized protein n=1 Tax=Portunus trituberculatus TaxID=210409 RepID=A0A5B7DAG5_PORTR|nr:hypothetical protein [Portunus trituberculatus]